MAYGNFGPHSGNNGPGMGRPGMGGPGMGGYPGMHGLFTGPFWRDHYYYQSRYMDTARRMVITPDDRFIDTYRKTRNNLASKYEKLPKLGVNVLSGFLAIPRHIFRKSIYAREVMMNSPVPERTTVKSK